MPSVVAPTKYQRRTDVQRPPRATPPPPSYNSPARSATPGRSATTCPGCGKSDFENDNGQLVCKNDGIVISSDGNFRMEVEFDEVQSGATKMRGTHIGANQTHAHSYHSRVGAAAHINSESTPAIISATNFAKTIWERCAQMLSLNQSVKDKAGSLFTLAYTRGFYRGRTLESVALVCIYLAVRKSSNKSLMLIDFAEVGDMNVFELGNMAKALHEQLYMAKWREAFVRDARDADVNEHRLADQYWEQDLKSGIRGQHRTNMEQLYLVEPEDLISRFCDKLDFGDSESTRRVKNDAVKIAKSMKREWMVDGRRPAGVAGAAVILAARMNNFRRTLREVVLVAKVTEVTLGKRIEEFKETKSSTLSVTQFRSADPEKTISLEEAENLGPPSMYRAQPEWQAKQAKKKINNNKKRRRKKKSAPITAAEIENGEVEETETETETEANNDDDIREADNDDDQPPAKRPRIDADGFVVPEIPTRTDSSSRFSQEPSSKRRRTTSRPSGGKNWPPPPTEAEIVDEEELADDIRDQLRQNASLDPTGSIVQSVTSEPSTESESPAPDSGVVQIVYPGPQRSDPAGPPVDGNIGNLGDICCMDETIGADEFEDDIDVAGCLLDEEQRKFKETVWVKENEDWLRAENAKKVRRELRDKELREKGIDPEAEAKKKKIRKDGNRVSGRVGDVSYLEDARQKNGEKTDGNTAPALDEEGRRRQREQSVSQNARAGVHTMLQQRGTYSRRVDYAKLTQAYNLPGMDDSSEGDAGSQSRSQTPQSPATTKEKEAEGFFRPALSRGVKASMIRRAKDRMMSIGGNTTAAETDAETEAEGNDRSPSKSHSPAQDDTANEDDDAEFEEDDGTPESTPVPSGNTATQATDPSVSEKSHAQTRTHRPTKASNLRNEAQLPTPSPTQSQPVLQPPSQDSPPPANEPQDLSLSTSASPLSSTHTPAGYGPDTPTTQPVIGSQKQPHQIDEEEEEGDGGDYWSGEEIEDDDEDDEQDDEDLDKYFAGQAGEDGEVVAEVMMGDEEQVVDDDDV